MTKCTRNFWGQFAVTFKSRKLGREIEISRPGSYYLYADTDGEHPGTLGAQICEGGTFSGNTIGYSGDDYDEFERICQSWYRAYIRNTEKCW